MLHIPALWYFDTSVTYGQWFRKVKFVVIPPRFVLQQYLWNIAIQPAVDCYNSWANLRCSSCSPVDEKSLWNGTIEIPMCLKRWSLYWNAFLPVYPAQYWYVVCKKAPIYSEGPCLVWATLLCCGPVMNPVQVTFIMVLGEYGPNLWPSDDKKIIHPVPTTPLEPSQQFGEDDNWPAHSLLQTVGEPSLCSENLSFRTLYCPSNFMGVCAITQPSNPKMKVQIWTNDNWLWSTHGYIIPISGCMYYQFSQVSQCKDAILPV